MLVVNMILFVSTLLNHMLIVFALCSTMISRGFDMYIVRQQYETGENLFSNIYATRQDADRVAELYRRKLNSRWRVDIFAVRLGNVAHVANVAKPLVSLSDY